MQKVLIHYFSGTGNSLLAAKQLSNELKKYGYDVVFHPVEDGAYNNHDAYSLHIFFFPIYATAVPHIMLKYLRNLPNGRNVQAAVISTNGRISTRFRDGYQGWALHQARLFLKLKNYDVFFSDTLDYPHNITVGIPPRNEKNNQKIIELAADKIAPMAEKIANGQKLHRGFFLPNIVWSVPFGILYTLFWRRFIGKMFAADSTCNSCKLCVKQCPVKGIRVCNGQIRWGWNCEGCLRCINSCPKHAIQTSALRALAIIGAAFINPQPLIAGIFPVWLAQSTRNVGYSIFNILTEILLYIFVVMLLDWIIYKISFMPILKIVASWGVTRLYGRYSAKSFEDKF